MARVLFENDINSNHHYLFCKRENHTQVQREVKVTGQKRLRRQEGIFQRGLAKALGLRVQISERR